MIIDMIRCKYCGRFSLWFHKRDGVFVNYGGPCPRSPSPDGKWWWEV